MSANRYPDNSRYTRDRSPPYRDRRPSTFGGSTYPPRGSESSSRPNPDSSGFPPRDTPRGPKSLGDAPRGPTAGPPSGAPPAPRDGRARGFTGRGDDTPLRNAPPLSSGPAAPSHNTHSSWRADRDRDRDRDFDRRERRPTPPRRSPIRDSRDPRDQRDFAPRDLDVGRARRNSRDGGPPSAGSNYSDPPLGAGSTYRGSGVGRGRGGRDFAGRGRPFHPDERDRHHDSRDRTWRPRSRSPPPIRRDRDPRDDRRDDRDLDRRDRDDRRFPREYDSYIGPAGAAKAGPRALDTHRGPTTSDSRYLPGTPTGPTPHSSHHASPSDRLGPQTDSYPRRSSVAVDSTAAKDARREPGKDEALLASRAEASRERYAPRASSPPAAVPAFGSNVWRAPTTESKPSTATPAIPKPVVPVTAPATTTVAPTVTPSTSSAPVAPPASSAAPAPAPAAPSIASVPPAPKPPVPSGLNVAPPTGPKADRIPDRPLGDAVHADSKAIPIGPSKSDSTGDLGATAPPVVDKAASAEKVEPKVPTAPTAPAPAVTPVTNPPPSTPSAPSAPSGPSASSAPAKSPPQGPAPKPRQPPTAPQAALRANTSPQFSRAPFPPYAARDPSPSIAPSPAGPRTGNASTTATVNTSPKSLPANIPTGPKADRTPMAPRAPPMYPTSDRLHFSAPRAPISGGPKSMQWVRPGLIPGRPAIPSKREFPAEDRDRAFGTAPKAPKLESNASTAQPPRGLQAPSESNFSKALQVERPKERAASAERPVTAPSKPTMIETRRHSDVFMAEASPRLSRPPMSATSSAPEALEDSEDEVDLDEDDFAGIEAKYNRERELLEARRIDLSAPHLRATTPLHEIYLMNCITVDHLHSTSQIPEPELEPESISEAEPMVIEEPILTANGPPVSEQKPLARSAAELLTPKNDLPDDVDMDEKEDKSPAPATVALRLRRGVSIEPDTMPDLSSLPYLGSGPPTPLSDIEQVRPKLSDDVMSAIRDKLRKSIEPELSTEQILQQYASVYRQWRLHIRPMDEERDIEDQERQPSAEPSLKATTPDVSTASMPGLLDMPLTVSGRRGHSSRWATELDLEQAIKESLKTAAEEERIGKTDREPRRAMADPEKEAELPLELNDSEAQRRRYRDTNFQREPGQGIFVFHYEPPEDDFTPEEHRVMVQNYRDQYAKKWGKLAEILYKEVGTERTYKDCINHYYSTKWGREYKGKVKGRRGGPRKRGGGVGRGRGAIANMDRPEITGEDGAAPQVTETGRPRRSAAPKFGELEADFDPASGTPTPGGRARRQTDADSTQEKTGKRGKVAKEKGSRKAKQMQLAAAAPTGSPVKLDRKEKMPGVKSEDDLNKRTLGEMQVPLPIPVNPAYIEDQMLVSSDGIPPMSLGFMERPKTQANTRPGPSSYWSVSELQDFDKNVAHFGTDWVAIANHMGSKTHTMIKNQYLRLLENGRVDLEQAAKEADGRRERGDNLGPPPTPTPAPKRRYESTQTAIPRQLAPTPELTKSPLLSAIAMQKTTPPHSGAPSRFSAIAQAPMPGKPLAATAAFASIPETSLASIPSLSQQSPPGGPSQRPQVQHQHTLSQSKPQYPPPRAGQFSDEPSRHDGRSPQQLSQKQGSRASQHVPSTMRLQEQHPTSSYRTFGHHEREAAIRQETQQEHESQHRYQQHARRVSQHEAQRHFSAASVPPLAPPVRSNSGARSPERPPTFTHSHSRHPSQTHTFGQTAQEAHQQGHNVLHGAQQVPQRSLPVKEEPRNSPAPSVVPPAQNPPQGLHQHSPYGQPPMQNIPAPPVSKPAAEPRKSNLMFLMNDTDEEEPKRKKPSDAGPPSHSTTPSQQTPIAPPPPTSQALPARRGIYDDPYGRSSYSQQTSVPPANPNRPIDLTTEQSSTSRSVTRDGWPPRQQQYMPAQNQAPQQTPGTSHSSLPQPPFGDSNLYRHRSVFASHNDPRHNPSPPPLGAYNNSPHMQSRTPSISGAPTGPPRHGVPSTSAGHHPGTPGASAHILQPNPYAQVDPPGSAAPPSGPMGMRPSPHLHTNHIVQQRDMHGRNEQSQAQNAGLPYSNPQTPIEHPSHQPPRAPSGMADPYRPRDPRDSHHEYQSRHMSDRDTSREISQRADTMLRDHLSSSMRSTPLHDDLRYQPQHHDRSYLTQRSHTPLSRPDPSQPAPLQHPPQSALGTNNHAAWSQQQRPTEDPLHRPPYQSYNPRDRSMTDRIREEQAAAMNRDDHLRREDERQRHDAQMRDSLLRGSMRGLPPGSSTAGGPGAQQPQDQRPGHSAAGSMDWASGVARHPQESWRR